MGIRRISDLQLGSIGSTKVYTITTSETAYQISSGMRAVEVGNLGNYNIFYGQSNLMALSGLFISSQGGAKFWDSVTDNFKMYFRITSGGITTPLILQEYLGNG